MDPADSIPSAELLAEAGFLSRLARGLVRDEHAAADLVQATWLVALERPPLERRSLRTWLATVAANLARNARRGERRAAERERRSARGERVEPAIPLERLELQRALIELVLSLPEEQRTVLYLRYYEELGPAAIAAHLGVPLKTVKSRLTRALAALRERLDARSRGDRRAWLEALAPLALPSPLAHTGVGAVAMKKALIAGAALAVAFLAWRLGTADWLRERRGASRPERVSLAVEPLETEPARIAPPLAADARASRQPLAPVALAASGTLAITLRHSDGTPAGDFPFALECRNDPAPRVEAIRARTDADGTATLAELHPGLALIWVAERRFETEVTAGTTRSVELALDAGYAVEGLVVDEQGLPVAGAEIWCGRSQFQLPGGSLLATSSSTGTFRLKDVEAFSAVSARKRGYRPSQGWYPLDMQAETGGARAVRLVLRSRGGSVRGRVLDAAGQPQAGAWVLAGPDGGWTSGAESGIAPEPAFAETDEFGLFELGCDLAPGRQPIHASARGFPVWRGEVDVPAEGVATLEIRLESPARIEGRLLDSGGAPVAGLRVLAAEEERGGWYHDRLAPSEAVSDAEGWFVLEWVAPGLRELNAHDWKRPELGRARASVACTAGETATCELHLELGRTLSGTVRDGDGAPLAGWGVESQTPLLAQWYPRRARTDAEGRFLLANLGNGAHDLIVRAPESGEERARRNGVPTGSSDVVLVVADAHLAPGRLRGRLVPPAGVRPDGFNLTLHREGVNGGRFIATDAGGAIDEEVTPGRYRVQVQGGGRDLLTSATIEVEAGSSADLGELRLEAGGRVELTLTGLPVRELARLRLTLDREGCSSVPLEVRDGAFRSPELVPGRWRVAMNTSDLCLRPSEVEVPSGATAFVELRLEPTVRVRLLVANPANDEVTVEATDASGARIYQRRWLELPPGEAPGEQRLSVALPRGRATIRLRTHAGQSGELDLEVTPEIDRGPPIRIELR
jgi:RNA polymerase sigma-70 factor (ECF subfamily)